MSEQWKHISEYEGFYQVSSLGRIKSATRILRPAVHRNGYVTAVLCVNQRRRYFLVHRLIAAAFIGDPHGKVVNHKNGIKTDNRVNNLELVTPSENNHHAVRIGTMRHGTTHYRAKLTAQQVQEARTRYRAGGVTVVRLAREYGLRHGPMWNLLQRRSYKDVP